MGGWVDYGVATDAKGFPLHTFHLPGYDTLDLSAGYDFGHAKIKLQVFNLLDTRAVSSFTPGSNTASLFPAGGVSPKAVPGGDGNPDLGIYNFQAGRQIEVTLIGKF